MKQGRALFCGAVLALGALLGGCGGEKKALQSTGPAPAAAAPVLLPMTSLPPPDREEDSDPYRAFTDYALARVGKAAPGVTSASVIFDVSSSLDKPRLLACRGRNYAVLLDLDPGGIMFDPAEPGQAELGLVARLASLRTAGLTILWMSSLSLDATEAIQARLAASGLDSEGADRLLLRYTGERKQQLRQTAARDYCIIAIAGDRGGDFDELYDYLRDPAYANALEPMFGKGWFLVPPPLQQP